MFIKNEVFLIFGMSKSGYSATNALLNLGAKCYLYEENSNQNLIKNLDELVQKGAVKISENELDAVLTLTTVLVVSPGIAINHPICVKAKSLKKRIIGELELGSTLIKSPIIAVTGTNGKTTTVSMLGRIFEEAGQSHQVVGNIGVPICSKIKELSDFNTLAVTEVSSFQLETVHSFSPHIACVLNVAPDHLERHYTMENYAFLKSKILKNLRESEYAVLNADDLYFEEFSKKTRAKVLTFSMKNKNANAYYFDGALHFGVDMIIHESEMGVKGEHNILNALASICIAKAVGVDNQTINNALKNYKGEKHRIELVGKLNNKEFYDDSKGTNIASTLSAIKCMNSPTVLILGGKDKGESYEELFTKIKDSSVVYCVLTGENASALLKTAVICGYDKVCLVDAFDTAVKVAEFFCPKNGCVLLSPASASFDRFSGYAERGEYFCKVVKSLEKNERFD